MNKAPVNVHAVIPVSLVNGPGRRLVVFLQGCSRGCPGCFNPDTHPFEERSLYAPEDLIRKHLKADVEGLTVSGGEPFDQPLGLCGLLRTAKREFGLTTVVYTGYSYEELLSREEAAGCLPYMDVLIDGAYEEGRRERTLLARGSTNQRLHFLTPRYSDVDFMMPGRIEVLIGPDGTVLETGFGKVPLRA